MIESNILSHRRMGEYVNFTMVPGTAPLVKRRLREIYKDHIFSIVADDDTILLIAYSAQKQRISSNQSLGGRAYAIRNFD